MDILFRYARALLFKRASVRYDVYSERCAVLRLRSRFQKETEIFACAAAFVCSDSGFDLLFLAAVS